MNALIKLSLPCLALALSACTAITDADKIDYRGAVKAPTLDVPPDLTQLSKDPRYSINAGPVSAAATQQLRGAGGPTLSTVALSESGDVRLVRQGTLRWLVTKRTPEQVWDPLRQFWGENGFALIQDQANIGIMETDWAENRAKLPQDIIRSALGKFFDGLYSTGERDKFRTRVERGTEGTEIFIVHMGLTEAYTNYTKDQTKWQPRANDLELENEFLRRLMVKLGASSAVANAQFAAAGSGPNLATVNANARIVGSGADVALQLNDNFDRAWRRIGLALDRTGFTVEDRDRNKGTYFVRYVAPNANKEEPGFFARLWSGSKTPETTRYRVVVQASGATTLVKVLDANGAPDKADNAQRIVQVLADDLK